MKTFFLKKKKAKKGGGKRKRNLECWSDPQSPVSGISCVREISDMQGSNKNRLEDVASLVHSPPDMI